MSGSTINVVTDIIQTLKNIDADFETNISSSISNVNNTSYLLYTVSNGVNLYLTFASADTSANGTTELLVRDTSDNILYTILFVSSNATTTGHGASNFTRPLKIPTGYDIVVRVSASAYGSCYIYGYEK